VGASPPLPPYSVVTCRPERLKPFPHNPTIAAHCDRPDNSGRVGSTFRDAVGMVLRGGEVEMFPLRRS